MRFSYDTLFFFIHALKNLNLKCSLYERHYLYLLELLRHKPKKALSFRPVENTWFF